MRATIVDIHPTDAYYKYRRYLVGKEITIDPRPYPNDGEYVSGTATLDTPIQIKVLGNTTTICCPTFYKVKINHEKTNSN